jgi:hypothetical protein
MPAAWLIVPPIDLPWAARAAGCAVADRRHDAMQGLTLCVYARWLCAPKAGAVVGQGDVSEVANAAAQEKATVPS